MTRIDQLARRAARLAWLRIHGTDLPGAYGDITRAQQTALDAARVALIAAGIYAGTNDPRAMRWGIRLLISELRDEGTPTRQDRGRQRWIS